MCSKVTLILYIFSTRRIYIGMFYFNDSLGFRWIDGSVATWSRWNSREPDGGGRTPYIGLSWGIYADFGNAGIVGMCEKSGNLI